MISAYQSDIYFFEDQCKHERIGPLCLDERTVASAGERKDGGSMTHCTWVLLGVTLVTWHVDAPALEIPDRVGPLGAATYLDTLNAGQELSIAAEDLATRESSMRRKSGASGDSREVTPDGFRIQILASTSLETIREKKLRIESGLVMRAYVGFEEPYYKLCVGDFPGRDEAEEALVRIREQGYPDAWIVHSKVFSGR